MFKDKKNIGILFAVLVVLAVAFFSGEKLSSNGGNPTYDGNSSYDGMDNKAESEPSVIEMTKGEAYENTTKQTLQTAETAQQTGTERPAAQETQQTVSEVRQTATTEAERKTTASQTTVRPAASEKQTTTAVKVTSAAPTTANVPTTTSRPASESKTQIGVCQISISCSTVLDHMDSLAPEKKRIIPADGWILKTVTAPLYEGDSVFDVLNRICRERKIHMEFSMTPVYNSAYIEGIANLYAFDCGDDSGWTYKVNGVKPNVGCSGVMPADGDMIEWIYTCELGKDVE